MITATYQLGPQQISAKVEGNALLFFDAESGMITTLEGLRFSRAGVLKEFPDLKEEKEWRKVALERLKEHLKTFQTEKEKMNYVTRELVRFGGYLPLFWQQKGFRVKQFFHGEIL